MKLLPKAEARSRVKKENDELIESNIRLRKYDAEIRKKLSTIKDDYEPEKLQKLKEYEQFCKDIQARKSALLAELAQWQVLIEDTKDVYYGLIAKQDRLMEREYQIAEENKKLDLRQAFVLDLEEKWRNKQ